jgi:AcrR family transcriptional regulator
LTAEDTELQRGRTCISPKGLDAIKKNEYSFFIPKLTEAALDERRDHILRAAELCFARKGFHGTTIADVREQAGVSTGAIYTYFPNKEAMMRAILERARDDRKRQLDGGGNGTVDPSVIMLGWASAVFTAQGQHAARVDVNLWAESLRNPRVQKLAHGALQDATSAVSAVVAARLPSSGAANSLEPASIAQVLIALFLGLEVQTAVGMRLEANEVLRVLGTLFVDYLPPDAANEPVAQRKRPRKKGRT